mmetsp:Transcript_15241/g.20123  ORF Transcript_15241/g.20123 Transcript_15241/m.20123 type:complete len:203 (-) Transcript_15241:620-1228(-)
MLLKYSAYTRRNFRVAELRHRREQVVLNLKVEETHPPVAPPALVNIHSVESCIAHPVNLFIVFWYNRKMGVADSKVQEDVGTSHPHIEQVASKGSTHREDGAQVSQHSITETHACELIKPLGSESVARVEVQLPSQSHHQAGNRHEAPSLQLQPPRGHQRLLFPVLHFRVEHQQWKGVQIHVVAELLRGSMMFVMLIPPPST